MDVTALDGNGGSSASARGSQTVGSGASHAVAALRLRGGRRHGDRSTRAAATTAATGGATRSNAGRFGRALSFDGEDDMATVPDGDPIDVSGSLTLEAWVRPKAATNWRTVLFKESAGGVSYALYASSDTDVPSVNLGGDPGARAPSDLDPDKWTPPGRHLRRHDAAPVRERHAGRHARAARGARGRPGRPADLRRQQRLGRALQRPHRRGADLQPRPQRGRDRRRHGRPGRAGHARAAGRPGRRRDRQLRRAHAWPIVPVHLALTSNGQVAAWDGFEAALNSERLWNPATETFLSIPTGRNLFCAGQVTLDDGRLAVFGGHEQAYEGIKDTNLYDPQAGTWTRGADMSVARWYPTATALPDGRVFVVSGDNITLKEPGMSVPLTDASNTLPSIYDPQGRHVDRPPGRLAADAALPVHVRAARTASCSTPGPTRPRGPSTSTPSSGRPSARARSTATAR